jgi:hypothetical protein
MECVSNFFSTMLQSKSVTAPYRYAPGMCTANFCYSVFQSEVARLRKSPRFYLHALAGVTHTFVLISTPSLDVSLSQCGLVGNRVKTSLLRPVSHRLNKTRDPLFTACGPGNGTVHRSFPRFPQHTQALLLLLYLYRYKVRILLEEVSGRQREQD